MAPSTTSNPVTRQGGLALIVGVILLVLASLLFPGGVMDPVDQTDFSAALDAAAANASLAHLASMLSIIGMFLYGYAAFTWLRWPSRDPVACACG